MDTVADRGRELLRLRENAAQDSPADLCRRLIASRGEASNIALAREILQRFEALDEGQKTAFLLALAEEVVNEVEAEESGPAGDEDAFCHGALFYRFNRPLGGLLQKTGVKNRVQLTNLFRDPSEG